MLAASILIFLVVVPCSAADYGPASFTSDGVTIIAGVTAGTPWESPFAKEVVLTVGVTPQLSGVTQVNVTEVSISINRYDSSSATFILVAARSKAFPSPVTGSDHANFTSSLLLSGTTSGAECYFALAVSGDYTNGTDVIHFLSTSSENLIGPFVISVGAASPLFIVGLAMMGLFSAVMVLGVLAVKKSQGLAHQKRRLDERGGLGDRLLSQKTRSSGNCLEGEWLGS